MGRKQEKTSTINENKNNQKPTHREGEGISRYLAMYGTHVSLNPQEAPLSYFAS